MQIISLCLANRRFFGMHSENVFFGGGFFMILFWLLLGIGVFWILKRTVFDNNRQKKSNFIQGKNEKSSERESPLEIAKRRLAKGEITTKEFEEIKSNLEK